MTPYEGELITKYLTHLIILGEYGGFADFEEWYQLVRYANGAGAPRTVEEVSEPRYKGVLEAARIRQRSFEEGRRAGLSEAAAKLG
jgi:hypothetical protein